MQSLFIAVVTFGVGLYFGFASLSEFSPGPDIEAKGTVIGYGCADRGSQELDGCSMLYSVVRFIDSNGQLHNIHYPEELTGLVSVRYRYTSIPFIGIIGLTVERADPRWLRGTIFAIVSAVTFALTLMFIVDYRRKKLPVLQTPIKRKPRNKIHK